MKLAKREKRGQVTFFIIVGIVLIMLVLGMYVVINMVGSEEAETELEASIQTADIKPLEEFTQSCVTYTVNDAFLKLGQQGGVLLSDVGGPVQLSTLEKDDDYIYSDEYSMNIAYGIKQYQAGTLGFEVEVPDYPTTSFPFLGTSYMPIGLFGYVSLSALEDPLDPANPNTMKGDLLYFISRKIPECTANFTNFPGFEVIQKPVNVTIDFNDQSTQVRVNYPLDIRKKGTNDFFHLETFDRNLDIKMLRMYRAIRDMLHEEVKNVTYQMEFREYDMIKVVKIENDISGSGDDIVVIEDTSSRIDGKPYRMNILIKNRPPALHYIDQYSLSQIQFIEFFNINASENDYIIIQDSTGQQIYSFNETISAMDPIGEHRLFYDPDDMDEHEASFSLTLPDIIEYAETPAGGSNGRKSMTVYISDGEYTDFQEVNFEVI